MNSCIHLKSHQRLALKMLIFSGNIVVILFTSLDIVNSLFGLIKITHSNPDTFTWIGTDAWSGRTVHPSVQDVAENSLAVQPEVKHIPEFESYFKR